MITVLAVGAVLAGPILASADRPVELSSVDRPVSLAGFVAPRSGGRDAHLAGGCVFGHNKDKDGKKKGCRGGGVAAKGKNGAKKAGRLAKDVGEVGGKAVLRCVTKGAESGAEAGAAGALVGSAVPGIGTATGGGAGAVGGAGAGCIKGMIDD